MNGKEFQEKYFQDCQEKWIGEKISTNGSYVKTSLSELRKKEHGKRLYIFSNRYTNFLQNDDCYISDVKVINEIESFLEKNQITELIGYLYSLFIEKFGIVNFIVSVDHKMQFESNISYKNGFDAAQKAMRNALGL
jgi:hypothetical protein